MTRSLAMLLLVAPVVPIGSSAPAFTAKDDRGVTRSLSDFRGQWVVLERHEEGSGHMQRCPVHYAASRGR